MIQLFWLACDCKNINFADIWLNSRFLVFTDVTSRTPVPSEGYHLINLSSQPAQEVRSRTGVPPFTAPPPAPWTGPGPGYPSPPQTGPGQGYPFPLPFPDRTRHRQDMPWAVRKSKSNSAKKFCR